MPSETGVEEKRTLVATLVGVVGYSEPLFLLVVVAEISPVFEISELPTFVCPNHLLQSPWTLLFEVFDLVFLVLNFLTLYTVYMNVDMVYTKN